jgi:predicted ester cyclase
MSAENKAVVRRLFEDFWNNRERALADNIFVPNCAHHDPNTPDFGKGPEGEKRIFDLYTTAFPDSRFTIEQMIAEGDTVATRWTVRGTHKGELLGNAPTNKSITLTGTALCRVLGGKIVESWSNWDALGMFQQLGIVGEFAKAKHAAR